MAGSGDMAKGPFLQSSPSAGYNVLFLRSAAEVMALGGELARIHARSTNVSPLRETQSWERDLLVYWNLLGVPLLILAVGLLRYAMRVLRAQRHEERYLRERAA